MKTTLRIDLPRLAELQPESRVAFVLLDARSVLRHGELPLCELAEGMPAARVAAVLHPCDVTLGMVDVPPLATHRMAAALPAVVEQFTLADPDAIAIAHGPRNEHGRLPVAWADKAPLQRAWATLADTGLLAEALVPAPLAIPLAADGMTLMLRDGAVLARLGADEGHALATASDPDEAVVVWLSLLLRQMPEASITWVNEVPAWWPRVLACADSEPGTDASGERSQRTTPSVIPPESCRAAKLPVWSLALPELRPPRMQRSVWLAPLIWLGGAAAVWLLGLNLYAGQMLAEEKRLTQRMSQQVREAFPDIPVVLDPLRQATQQRDARRTSLDGMDETGFLPLALSAARLLPDAAHNVTRLDFGDDTLTLEFADNAAMPAGELDPALATRAHELGLQVDRQQTMWMVRRQDEQHAPSAAERFAITPGPATARHMKRAGEAG